MHGPRRSRRGDAGETGAHDACVDWSKGPAADPASYAANARKNATIGRACRGEVFVVRA
ncbi:MAG TPA: hypothetical protein VE987_13815 [Polyangiaceae bacterium]|nr:hypothetical protein [Polyangiaceae bacterium]